MNTTTAAQVSATDMLHSKSIDGIRWTDGAKVFGAPSRSYGITDAAGRWLSSDGINPSYWGRLATARQIAEDLVLHSYDEQFTPGGVRKGWAWIAPVAA